MAKHSCIQLVFFSIVLILFFFFFLLFLHLCATPTTLYIQSDGSYKNGAAGYGWVAYDDDNWDAKVVRLRQGTIDDAELSSAIDGVQQWFRWNGPIVLFVDSKFSVDGMHFVWKLERNPMALENMRRDDSQSYAAGDISEEEYETRTACAAFLDRNILALQVLEKLLSSTECGGCLIHVKSHIGLNEPADVSAHLSTCDRSVMGKVLQTNKSNMRHYDFDEMKTRSVKYAYVHPKVRDAGDEEDFLDTNEARAILKPAQKVIYRTDGTTGYESDTVESILEEAVSRMPLLVVPLLALTKMKNGEKVLWGELLLDL